MCALPTLRVSWSERGDGAASELDGAVSTLGN